MILVNLFIALGALAVFALVFSVLVAIVLDWRARRRHRRCPHVFTASLEPDWDWPSRTNGHEAEKETA